VLGITVPFGQNPVGNHDYIVATKTFSRLKLNLGYGTPYQSRAGDKSNLLKSIIFESKNSPLGNDYLVGFFGGASYRISNSFGLNAEYNTNTINTGLFYSRDWLMIQLNTFEFKALCLTFSSQFTIE
jgi:hypothetical protein